MAGNKPNPILAAFEAKKEAQFAQRKACLAEIDRISWLLAGNRLGFIAEKRASQLLEEQIKVKVEVAKLLAEDAEVDPSLTYTKADLARSVKQVLGRSWKKYRYLFPLLRDYWDD